MFQNEVEIYIYKRSVAIYLNGEFVFFLSHNYVQKVYNIDIPSGLIVNPGNVDFFELVKREKLNRVKLNKL